MGHGGAVLALAGLTALSLSGTGVEAGRDARAGAPTITPNAAQEAEVAGVVVDPDTQQAVLVLRGKRDRRTLAMAIGPMEASGIAVPLQGLRPPRPLTHDLLLAVIRQLRGVLLRVVVTDLRDGTYLARLHVDAGGTTLDIDSRPSDAIALALRAGVPILVEDRVFEKASRHSPTVGGGPTL